MGTEGGENGRQRGRLTAGPGGDTTTVPHLPSMCLEHQPETHDA